MTTSKLSFRETARVPSPHNPADRYLASDFKKLTNRVTRRLTSPGFTPDYSLAHGSGSVRSSRAPAASESGVASSDKRASLTPYQNAASGAPQVNDNYIAHGNNTTTLSGQSSRCSSIRPHAPDPFDVCVKEDDSGKCGASAYSDPFVTQYILLLYCALLFSPFLLPICYLSSTKLTPSL